MKSNPQTAISKGLGFLSGDQEKDGSFMCLVSTNLDDYSRSKAVPAIVPTNIVLSSLIHIKNDESKNIKDKAANFLLGERNQYWSFNYWFKKSDWFKREPYPDDLDDTFCALAALYEYKPAIFTGEVMAKIVTMLTSAEKEEGGPYDMWLVPPEGRKTWNDTDLVVNSNVAYFLSLQDISLPKLSAFIEKSIDEEDYEFPYNKIYPGLYFISRFYQGKKAKKMADLILSRQENSGKWENPLRTALAVSALINLPGSRARRYRAALEKGINYLLQSQSRNGSWAPASFYFQMRTKKKTLYAGSSSISTSLCLEALNKWHARAETSDRTTTAEQDADSTDKKIYTAAVKMLKDRFAACGEGLKQEASKVIAKTIRNDKDKQILLLPYFFKRSLGEFGNDISDNLLVRLGAANAFGWIAYTIYDDFFDNEGDAKLLSVANVALRESSRIFEAVLPRETGFPEFSRKIFDTVDAGNAWEMYNCRLGRLPDYGGYAKLAEKSLGHALGPLAILFALGYKGNSTEIKNLTAFFRHYLIARQLNDDAHDWEDDLAKGHINAVAVRLPANKEHNKEKLRQLFWEKIIVPVCSDILRHTELARRDLKELSIIKNTQMFENLLAPIEAAARKALKEREEAMSFVKSYL